MKTPPRKPSKLALIVDYYLREELCSEGKAMSDLQVAISTEDGEARGRSSNPLTEANVSSRDHHDLLRINIRQISFTYAPGSI